MEQCSAPSNFEAGSKGPFLRFELEASDQQTFSCFAWAVSSVSKPVTPAFMLRRLEEVFGCFTTSFTPQMLTPFQSNLLCSSTDEDSAAT